MVNSSPSSPAHFSLAGNFTAEDIQELLGAMAGENQARSETETAAPSDGAPGSVPSALNATSTASLAANEESNDGCATRDEEDDGVKAQARSERKRSREKQRRSDVNKQFADLTQLIRQIESEESAGDELVASRLAFSPTNRVDLIARTIAHLERLRESNKKRKVEVDSLQKQLEDSKKAGEETAAKLKDATLGPAGAGKQVSFASIYVMYNCLGSLVFSLNITLMLPL